MSDGFEIFVQHVLWSFQGRTVEMQEKMLCLAQADPCASSLDL